jgi:hypothetical protein
MAVISFPIEIFRRLNAQITAPYVENIVRAVLSFKTSPTTRKTRSFVDFHEKVTVISFPIEIFRRLNAQITAFYVENIVHAVLSFETSPTTRKTRSFVDFNEKVTVISFPIEIFRRLNAQITAVYAENIVHAVLSVETSPTTR